MRVWPQAACLAVGESVSFGETQITPMWAGFVHVENKSQSPPVVTTTAVDMFTRVFEVPPICFWYIGAYFNTTIKDSALKQMRAAMKTHLRCLVSEWLAGRLYDTTGMTGQVRILNTDMEGCQFYKYYSQVRILNTDMDGCQF